MLKIIEKSLQIKNLPKETRNILLDDRISIAVSLHHKKKIDLFLNNFFTFKAGSNHFSQWSFIDDCFKMSAIIQRMDVGHVPGTIARISEMKALIEPAVDQTFTLGFVKGNLFVSIDEKIGEMI